MSRPENEISSDIQILNRNILSRKLYSFSLMWALLRSSSVVIFYSPFKARIEHYRSADYHFQIIESQRSAVEFSPALTGVLHDSG